MFLAALRRASSIDLSIAAGCLRPPPGAAKAACPLLRFRTRGRPKGPARQRCGGLNAEAQASRCQ
eukprot:5199664-Heterocapsa_arctica.AAC.1